MYRLVFFFTLLAALLVAPLAQAGQDQFYSTYALARHSGIRHEVALKIALSRAAASEAVSSLSPADRFAQGLREGNLMKASSGLPESSREAIGALVAIRDRLPLEALDCSLDSAGEEPNCLASAPVLANAFPKNADPRALTLTLAPTEANEKLIGASFSDVEKEAFSQSLFTIAAAPAAPAPFFGSHDAWTAQELLGENDATGARSFFEAMYEANP
jgi:hypothetical protein